MNNFFIFINEINRKSRIRKEQRTMILILSVSALLITSITTAWAIYSNNQMDKMQEKLWRLQEENEELKRQLNKKKAGDEAIREQIDKEIEERMTA